MTTPWRTLAGVVVVGSLALSACGGGQTRLPEQGPKTAEAVLKRALSVPLPKTLQAMSRMDSYTRGKARKADVLVRIERPGRAQFQALTPTLDMLAVLATDGQTFVSYQRGGQRCFTGQACPRNLARLVPIELPADQLVDAILGRPPLLSTHHKSLHWDVKRQAYRVHLGAEGARQQQDVWVQPRSFRFMAMTLDERGKRVASIAYSGLSDSTSRQPPRVMRLKVAARKIDLSLQLRDPTLDEAIESSAFAPPCPRGTVTVNLPCEASETRAG